ncbi:MAG: class I SAM-dependent methyltransferase [Steroidobacteraceae bacterium]|jgi:SAM-dependent methyltransferase
MNAQPQPSPLIPNELDLLESLVPLAQARILEAGCGAARLARELLQRHPGAELTGIEVDDRQHAKNLADPAPRLTFLRAGAQQVPFPDASFDGALMLKSLHHVPRPLMAQALGELARVVRPGGWLYVSEPVYAGDFNEVIRIFNDEREVRAAAQQAVDAAAAAGPWRQVEERRFVAPGKFRDFAEFQQRIVNSTFADHRLDEATLARVRAAFEPHVGPDGANFTVPVHVRLLRRAG